MCVHILEELPEIIDLLVPLRVAGEAEVIAVENEQLVVREELRLLAVLVEKVPRSGVNQA